MARHPAVLPPKPLLQLCGFSALLSCKYLIIRRYLWSVAATRRLVCAEFVGCSAMASWFTTFASTRRVFPPCKKPLRYARKMKAAPLRGPHSCNRLDQTRFGRASGNSQPSLRSCKNDDNTVRLLIEDVIVHILKVRVSSGRIYKDLKK